MADVATIPSDNGSEVVTADFTKNAGVDLIGYIGSLQEAGQRWDWSSVDGTLWCKSFPYQLAVLEAKEDGSYSIYRDLVFTLPINPEDLTNQMPFASTLSATLGGVVEQHGGAPFRTISFSGTFGVLPTRENSVGATWAQMLASSGGLAGGLLSNTVAAAEATKNQATATYRGPEFTPNVYQDSEVDPNGTGYFQYRQLQRFLESYAEARVQGYTNLRLALFIWKEQAAYIVQPRLYQVNRNAQSPHEYRYSLQLQAWRRVNPADIGYGKMAESQAITTKTRKANLVKEALQRLDSARKTLQGVRTTVLAIRTDFDATVGEALRQTALLLKDTAGVVKTLVDFPRAMREHVVEAPDAWWDSVRATLDLTDPAHNDVVATIDLIDADRKSGAGFNREALANILSDEDNAWLAEAIQPDNLNLPADVQDLFDAQVEAARLLTKDDYRAQERQTKAFVADYADRVGLGSASYNATMGFSTGVPQRDAIDEDFEALAALMDIAQTFGTLATYSDAVQPRVPTTIEYVAGIANAAGIRMRVPKSKFAVPFDYGSTLEKVAQQYLGDATRWGEIAALNDLRSPYVDEVGQELPLLVPGSGNEVAVSDASQLVLGQAVTVYNNTLAPQQRRVLGAERVAPGYWVVTLSGDPTLSLFKPSEGARLHWFSPYTVNSRQVIYIPSDNDPAIEDLGQYVPTQADLSRFLDVGDVDGMLNEKGDIVITPDGDWPFVFGIQSIVQWTRTALSTPRGSMPLHPEFGLPLLAGQSLADLDVRDVMASIRNLFRNGPAYTGVRSILVQQTGPTARVSFELGVRGADAYIPITFDVPRS